MDLISRQAAIEVLEWFDQTDPLGHTPGQIVRALPTAEPRKGKWIYGEDDGQDGWFCSECGRFIPWDCDECPYEMEESE